MAGRRNIHHFTNLDNFFQLHNNRWKCYGACKVHDGIL